MITKGVPGAPTNPSSQVCPKDLLTPTLQNLINFLDNPTAAAAKTVVPSVCKFFSDKASAPCNVSFSDELMSKFEEAAQKTSDVVSLIKCVEPATDLSSAGELRELQGRLLDKYKTGFFKPWTAAIGGREKIESFVARIPPLPVDGAQKIKILEERLATIEKASRPLKKEFNDANALLKERLAVLKKAASKNDDGDINFRTSRLRDLLAKRLTEKTFDQAKTTVSANQIILDEGLNFRARMKTEKNEWSVCSASTALREDSCHTAAVSFGKEVESCGTNGIFGLLFQSGRTWVLMAGSSSYRIETEDILTPEKLELVKDNVASHSWNLPLDFFPEFLATDLHNVYARTSIYLEDGKKAGDLHLVLRDNGRFQFVELPPSGLIAISGKESQQVKALDGSVLELRLSSASCH